MATVLLHDTPDFGDLIEVLAGQMGIDPGLVEKDYWIMHALWGLQAGGFVFELKGGTSLSKGYQLIHRFSEDDILIHPEGTLPVGRNHTKAAHVAAQRAFFDGLAQRIAIPGIQAVERDDAFDDPTGQMRGAGIRLRYPELNPLPAGVKTGVLLEAGFDQVSPNRPVTLSSWAYDFAIGQGVAKLTDNRAVDVSCYEPGYTFVEKLQTISTKFRQQQANGEMPTNFMRHYYDVYSLLGDAGVQAFISQGIRGSSRQRMKASPGNSMPDCDSSPTFPRSAFGGFTATVQSPQQGGEMLDVGHRPVREPGIEGIALFRQGVRDRGLRPGRQRQDDAPCILC